jgi:hypothetical protein
VNPSRLTRRLVAGVTGLLIGAASVLALASPASAHRPTVEGSAVCDEQTGEWVITWTVTNSETDLTGTLTEVAVDPPAELANIKVGATLPIQGDGPLSDEQRVPGDTTQASLAVTVEWIRDYQKIVAYGMKVIELGGDCAPPPEQPSVGSDFDCETLTVTVTNPTEEDLSLAFVPSVGDPVEATVAGGESATVEFPASEGLTVEVQLAGEPIEVEKPIEITPAEWAALECEEDDGEGGGLPVTGAPTAIIAGGAAALLALGAGLYLVFWRRRVTFTA